MKELKLSLQDFFLILLCLLACCAVFVAFLLATNLFVLLTIIFAVTLAIYLFNRVEQVKSLITGAFERR